MDITKWKLTLPVDSKGKFTAGKAAEVTNLDGYNFPPYFTQHPSGTLSFAVPVEGATTSGSKYPRCELREMKNGTEARWTANSAKRLRGKCVVNTAPIKADGGEGRVVIAQIHGREQELCRLYYDKGEIYYINDQVGSSKKETKFPLISGGVKLGQEIVYDIILWDKRLTVAVNGVSTSYTLEDHWLNDEFYFKTGLYCQVGKPGSGAGAVGKGSATMQITELFLDQSIDAGSNIPDVGTWESDLLISLENLHANLTNIIGRLTGFNYKNNKKN